MYICKIDNKSSPRLFQTPCHPQLGLTSLWYHSPERSRNHGNECRCRVSTEGAMGDGEWKRMKRNTEGAQELLDFRNSRNSR
jgi:hypothetical protein